MGTDLTEYKAIAEEAFEQLSRNETAMAIIGIGLQNELSIVETFFALGGLLNPELDIHAPPMSGAGEARQVLRALDALKAELIKVSNWSKAGLQLLLDSHDDMVVKKALIGSVGVSRSNIPVADLLFVLGEQRSRRWIEQASRAARNVAMIG